MDEEEDIGWWIDRLSGENTGSGFRVKTKSGMGRTYHRDELIFGKVPVYLDSGVKVLVDPEK